MNIILILASAVALGISIGFTIIKAKDGVQVDDKANEYSNVRKLLDK